MPIGECTECTICLHFRSGKYIYIFPYPARRKVKLQLNSSNYKLITIASAAFLSILLFLSFSLAHDYTFRLLSHSCNVMKRRSRRYWCMLSPMQPSERNGIVESNCVWLITICDGPTGPTLNPIEGIAVCCSSLTVCGNNKNCKVFFVCTVQWCPSHGAVYFMQIVDS